MSRCETLPPLAPAEAIQCDQGSRMAELAGEHCAMGT